MHWDGTSWTATESITAQTVNRLFGLSSTEMWGVGAAGTIIATH